jgi:hypothetical protein
MSGHAPSRWGSWAAPEAFADCWTKVRGCPDEPVATDLWRVWFETVPSDRRGRLIEIDSERSCDILRDQYPSSGLARIGASM